MEQKTLKGWSVGDRISDGKHTGRIVGIDGLGLWVAVGNRLTVVSKWSVPDKPAEAQPSLPLTGRA